MRRQGPFQPDDLDALGAFFETTGGVVAMREIHAGNRATDVIGLRHDVDGNPGSLEAAVAMARWEHERGWRSTYFLLHTVPFFYNGTWKAAADVMAELGHEIGFHTDCLAYCLEFGGDPHEMAHEVLGTMRDAGHEVIGVVGHGNKICGDFANDEQFTECARPKLGKPDRVISWKDRRLGKVRSLKLDPRPLAEFGLEYESIGLRQFYDSNGLLRTRPNHYYNTDSGCRWFFPFEETIETYRKMVDGQVHLLIHPDWWPRAFRLDIAA